MKTITTQNGLCNNVANYILKDSDGYAWIATEDGISRYNGHTFQNFYHNPKDTNSLLSNVVYKLFLDNKGTIWIGTFQGLCSIDPKSFKITRYKNLQRDSLGKDMLIIYDINQNPISKKIIVATHLGLFEVSKKNKTIDRAYNNIEYTKKNMHCVQFEKNGDLWFGGYGNTLHKISYPSQKLVSYTIPNTLLVNYFLATQLHNDIFDTNLLWIGTWGSGLIAFNKKKAAFKQYLLKQTNNSKGIYNIVLQITQGKKNNDNKLWFSSIDKCIGNLNTTTGHFEYYSPDNTKSLPGHGISYIENNIWLGTNEGLHIYTNETKKIQQYALPISNSSKNKTIYNITSDEKDSSIWINTYDEKNYRFSVHEKKFISHNSFLNDFFNKKRVLSYIRINNDAWCNVYNEGIYCINESNKTTTKVTITGPPEIKKHVHQLLAYNQDTIIVCDDNGIYFLETKTKKLHYLLHEKKRLNYNSINSLFIHDIFIDNHKDIWFTTESTTSTIAAIGKISKFKTVTFYNAKNSTTKELTRFGNIIIHKDTAYISTFNGLMYFDTRDKSPEFNYYTKEDGLPNNKTYDITITKNDIIAVSSLGGIMFWDKKTNQIKNFYKANGLVSDEIGLMHYDRNSDKIYLGFENEFNEIEPSKVFLDNVVPKTILDQLIVNNRKKIETENLKKIIELMPYENNVSFEFTAQDYYYGDLIKFKHKLDGIDKDWHISNNNKITYNQLPAGKYTLAVKTINAEGLEDENGIKVYFSIQNYWYKTWWFYLFCFFLLCCITYYLYRLKLQKIEALYKLRNTIAKDLHDEIGSTLSSIKILSGVSKKNIEKDPNKAITLMDKVQDYTTEVQENMSDIVWAINPSNDKYENLITKLKEYINYTLEQKNIRVNYNIEETLFSKKINMHYRKELLLILKEIINNIAKHANASQVDILIYSTATKIHSIIQDNGIGINTNKNHVGNGIQNITQRVKNLSGTITLSSNENSGLKVDITIPIHAT